jgi:hypothetical protein
MGQVRDTCFHLFGFSLVACNQSIYLLFVHFMIDFLFFPKKLDLKILNRLLLINLLQQKAFKLRLNCNEFRRNLKAHLGFIGDQIFHRL